MAQHKTGLAHALYTGKVSYPFIDRKKVWYLVSLTLIVISVLGLALRGLNLGIDFQGGVEFKASVHVAGGTTDKIRDAVVSSGPSDLDGTEVVSMGDDAVRVQTRPLSASENTTVRAAIASVTGGSQTSVTYSNVGSQWGSEITNKALQALLVFLVLVMIQIWAYFRNWKMAVAAIIALVHDVVITVGVYAIVGFSVTPSTLIGVLTILGYSLYDTVVVFDKVRENTSHLEQQPDRTFPEAVNLAINQVLVRSVNTTLIGVLPVAALLFAGAFVLGSGPLEDLGLALFVGMIAGAYSSIFIAAPIFSQFKGREEEIRKHDRAVAKRRSRAAEDAPRVKAQTVTSGAAVSAADLPEAPAERPARKQGSRTTRSQRKK
ncbi:protein translocase subunit SecF [Acidipropionibacterium virtanenii]|uniref:Protein-export membrane protein SecF n=1 Tax=Acidipropionibacterium virtanenii TaxID=2057246 RepID=A0A344UU26_9ACTN|nr:protein translocase subunit SecF [Acidipropionibacterium virtanenii]AXE38774.1 hypothetical protein JS278_01610 [Acidipropionibacterium virtanenii]